MAAYTTIQEAYNAELIRLSTHVGGPLTPKEEAWLLIEICAMWGEVFGYGRRHPLAEEPPPPQ